MLLLGPKNPSSKEVGTPGSDAAAEYTSLGGSLSSLDVSSDFPSLSFGDPAPVDVIPSALISLISLGHMAVASDYSSSLS
jgi:hypothetical protein